MLCELYKRKLDIYFLIFNENYSNCIRFYKHSQPKPVWDSSHSKQLFRARAATPAAAQPPRGSHPPHWHLLPQLETLPKELLAQKQNLGFPRGPCFTPIFPVANHLLIFCTSYFKVSWSQKKFMNQHRVTILWSKPGQHRTAKVLAKLFQ